MLSKTDEILDCINIFEDYYKCLDVSFKRVFSKDELRWAWFAENIVGVTFYDTELSIKWGTLLYKTIKSILNQNQEELLSEMYEEYLICLNLIGEDDLEWGTSIRFCWFQTKDIEQKYIEAIKQIDEI